VAIVGLVVSREGLLARPRQAGATRLPLLEEGAGIIAGYLGAEVGAGRVAADADVPTIAPTLIGAAHLLFADGSSGPERGGPPPDGAHGDGLGPRRTTPVIRPGPSGGDGAPTEGPARTPTPQREVGRVRRRREGRDDLVAGLSDDATGARRPCPAPGAARRGSG
jgi:hypothetical protein